MKKVKDSRKRWKQLVTMLLVTALLVTGTPDIVGLASEGTQEQVTTAADQSEGTQAEGQAEAAQEEEAISEEPVEQQDTSVQQDTAAKQENTEKNIENRVPQVRPSVLRTHRTVTKRTRPHLGLKVVVLLL